VDSVEKLAGATFHLFNRLRYVSFLDDTLGHQSAILAERLPASLWQFDLSDTLVQLGKYHEKLKFKIYEERAALFARKFQTKKTDRTKNARRANALDRERRERAVLATVAQCNRSQFTFKTSKRLNMNQLAQYVYEQRPFLTTKTGMGIDAIRGVLRRHQRDLKFKKQ